MRIHGTASLTIPVHVAVVSPLTTEGILGLDFQRALINLEREELLLQAQGITLPLRQSTQSPTSLRQVKVKVQRNISVPAYSELEPSRGPNTQPGLTWTLENTLKKPVGVIAAREQVPVRLMTHQYHI